MFFRNLLVGLLAILSLGALAGGGSFILFPEGYTGMTTSMLMHSPFSNFLIPGIILFTVLGLFPAFVLWGLLTKRTLRAMEAINLFTDMHWAWSFSVYIGLALLIWIFQQVYFIRGWHPLHFIYFYFGILILIITLLKPVREFYTRSR